MNKTLRANICLLLILLAISFLFVSCNKNKNISNDGEQDIKYPNKLLSIEEDIENIIISLNGPANPMMTQKSELKKHSGASDGKQLDQPEDQEQQDEGDEKQKDKGDEKQQDQKSQSNGQEGKTLDQQNPWTEVSKSLTDIHQKWNDYAPIATKVGATTELKDSFSGALNGLTKQTLTKDMYKTILAANSLYYYIDDFLSLYEENAPIGIKKSIYYARNSIINGNLGNWDNAKADIDSLNTVWSDTKNKLDKEKHEISNKIDFSIKELNNVVLDKSQALTDIKGRIVILNLCGLEQQYMQQK